LRTSTAAGQTSVAAHHITHLHLYLPYFHLLSTTAYPPARALPPTTTGSVIITHRPTDLALGRRLASSPVSGPSVPPRIRHSQRQTGHTLPYLPTYLTHLSNPHSLGSGFLLVTRRPTSRPRTSAPGIYIAPIIPPFKPRRLCPLLYIASAIPAVAPQAPPNPPRHHPSPWTRPASTMTPAAGSCAPSAVSVSAMPSACN